MASNGAVIVVQVLAANTAAVEFIILDLLLSLKTNKDEDEDEDEGMRMKIKMKMNLELLMELNHF